MALDATVRESNVWDSIRKFCVDNFARASAIPLGFDSGLTVPKVSGNQTVEKWVNVEQGQITSATVSEYYFRIICCTRKDNVGFKLTQLRDTVMGYLKPDGAQGIMPLYQTREAGAPTLVGGMIIYVGQESERLEADNEVKFKIIPIVLRWGAKT